MRITLFKGKVRLAVLAVFCVALICCAILACVSFSSYAKAEQGSVKSNESVTLSQAAESYNQGGDSAKTGHITAPNVNSSPASARSAEALATAWNAAVQESIDNGTQVTFTLTEDWTAQPDADHITSFGTGVGFSSGRIFIPKGANIILDLQTYTLDRGLEKGTGSSSVILSEGELEITGTTGTITGASGSGIFAVYGTLKISGGNITGNYARWNGGGVNVVGAHLILSGGSIYGNTVDSCGAGVYLERSTLEMMGGIIGGEANIGNSAVSGGGLYLFYSTAQIMGGVISNNSASAETLGGGGIYVGLGSSAVVSNVNISKNTANYAGGVYVEGRFEINAGAEITENTAENDGGAVWGTHFSDIKMTGGTVSKNTASTNGGGIYTEGTLTVDGGTFRENTSTTNYSGAIHGANATIIINDVLVTENTAARNGGGMYVWNTNLTLNGGTFDNNHGSAASGISLSASTCTVNGGTYSNNINTGSGGAFVAFDSRLIINDGLITDNSARNGGGILVYSSASLVVNGGIISNNSASGGSGGGIFSEGEVEITGGTVTGNNTDGSGAGIFIRAGASLFKMSGGTVSKNTAGSQGGGIFIANKKAVITGGLIDGNSAIAHGGITFYCQADNPEVIEVSGLTVTNNKATSHSAGIYVWNYEINLRNVTVLNNHCDGYGGGFGTHAGKISFYGGLFEGNTAIGDGAGMFIDGDCSVTLGGGIIIKNNISTGTRGGGLTVQKTISMLTLNGAVQITGNKAHDTENDLEFHGSKIIVTGSLVGSKIGFYTYETGAFTMGYSAYNSAYSPAMFFYSNSGKQIILSGGEAALGTESAVAPTKTLLWQIKSGDGNWQNLTNTTIVYDGNTYSVQALDGTTAQSLVASNGTAIKNAGVYSFMVNSADVKNPSVAITVTKKAVTVKWSDEELRYNGNIQYPSCELSGIAENDSISAELDIRGAGVNVGSYKLSIASLTGTGAGNYTLPSNSTVTYKILRAQVEKPVGGAALIYNGEEQTFNFNGFSSNIMRASGNVKTDAGNYTANITLNNDNYEWSDGTRDKVFLNWSIEKLWVTPVGGIVVKDKYYDGTDVVPSGYVSFDIGDVLLSGVLDKDKDNLGITNKASDLSGAVYDGANVGGHTVTVTGLVLTGEAAKNYRLTNDYAVGYGRILPAELKISGYTVQTKIYDGTRSAVFLKPLSVDGAGFVITAVNGAINLTDATAEYQALLNSVIVSGTFVSAGVGKNVSVSNIKFTYPAADEAIWKNYIILYDESVDEDLTGEITVRDAVVEVYDVSVTYGQTANLKYTYSSAKADGTIVDGILPQDDLGITLSRTDSTNLSVGKYTIVWTVGNTDVVANYNILFVRVMEDGVKVDYDAADGSTSPVYEITKASVKVVINPISVTYGNGLVLTDGDVTVLGLINGDVLDGTVALDTDASHYTDGVMYNFTAYDALSGTFNYPDIFDADGDRINYIVLATGYSSDNYEIEYVAGSLTVLPKKITVQIDGKTTVYGAPAADLPVLSWQLESGSTLLDGHSENDLDISLNRENGSVANGYEEVGRYLINGVCGNSNYEVNFRADYFVINPFEVTVNWYKSADDLTSAGTSFTYEYSASAQRPVATFTGLADPVTGIAAIYTSEDADTPFIKVNGSGYNVGTYAVQAILTDSKNFVFKDDPSNLTEILFEITAKKLAVKWYAKQGDTSSIILATNNGGSPVEYVYDWNKVYAPYAEAEFFAADVAAGVKIYVEGGRTLVGDGVARAYVTGSGNYVIDANTQECNFRIVLATYSDVKWLVWENSAQVEYTSGNKRFTYDGEAHGAEIGITGTLGNFTYVITDLNTNSPVAAAVNVGRYKITATPVNANIQLTEAQKHFEFFIDAMEVEVVWFDNDGAEFAGDIELEYAGKAQKPAAGYVDCFGQNIRLDVTLVGGGVNVGTYQAQVKLGSGVKNYVLKDANPNGVVETDFKIIAKAITVTWKLDENWTDLVYDGNKHNDGVIVNADLDNPVQVGGSDEIPNLAYKLFKDGKPVSEIKDAGIYTLKVELAASNGAVMNKNYAVQNGEYEIVIDKAHLSITAADQTITTGEHNNPFTAKFDGLVTDANGDKENPIDLGAAISAVTGDGTGEEYFLVNWLYSEYKTTSLYNADGYEIVLTTDEELLKALKEALKNYDWEDNFTAGLITLKVRYGIIKVSEDATYDGNYHEVKAWYFNGGENDDATLDAYWTPVNVEIYSDEHYTNLLKDADGNNITSVKDVNKYYIKLIGLPSNIDDVEAQSKKVYEITVRTVVVKIKDLTAEYGVLTQDNYKDYLVEHSRWDWDVETIRQPNAGDDLGIKLEIYKGLNPIGGTDFDAQGYLNVWEDGKYSIRGDWDKATYGASYNVVFEGEGNGVSDGDNIWGVCEVQKAEITFYQRPEGADYDQIIENVSISTIIDKNNLGEYLYFTYKGNHSASAGVTIYYHKISLDLTDNNSIPLPENDNELNSISPLFDLTNEEIAAGLSNKDRHYVVNFRISIKNHKDYYGQWTVQVLGGTVCVKIIFSDKALETVYGGIFADGAAVPEGKELTSYLLNNGYIDTAYTTVKSADDWAKLTAKVVSGGNGKMSVGSYAIVFEGVENIVSGKYVLTYKKQLSDSDGEATNLNKFVVNKRELKIDWGTTSFEYNGEKQLPQPTISGWTCDYDYAADGVYEFINDATGEALKIRVTLNGDFVSVGGHKYTVEIVDNGNYELDPVNATCAVSITGGILGGGTVVQQVGLAGWALGLIIAAAALALVVIIVLAVKLKNRKPVETDPDGFNDPVDL